MRKCHTPRKNSTTGIVRILMSVVMNVVNDTRLGSVPNCSANIVVLAAEGIEDCTMMTAFNRSLIGMK